MRGKATSIRAGVLVGDEETEVVHEADESREPGTADEEPRARPAAIGRCVRPSSEYSIITNYVSTRAKRCKGVVGVKNLEAVKKNGEARKRTGPSPGTRTFSSCLANRANLKRGAELKLFHFGHLPKLFLRKAARRGPPVRPCDAGANR